MTYENLKNNKVLAVTKSSAIEVDDLKNILLKHYDFPMENALVMTDKVEIHLHIPTKENIT
jgi:hypothetical protein